MDPKCPVQKVWRWRGTRPHLYTTNLRSGGFDAFDTIRLGTWSGWFTDQKNERAVRFVRNHKYPSESLSRRRCTRWRMTMRTASESSNCERIRQPRQLHPALIGAPPISPSAAVKRHQAFGAQALRSNSFDFDDGRSAATEPRQNGLGASRRLTLFGHDFSTSYGSTVSKI
jgi:hypothetical protein